jgi:flagellar protein FliS
MNKNTFSPAGGRGASAYAMVSVESGVMNAEPHALIVMLFDRAETSIRSAKVYMADGNVVAKGVAISKAIDIVNRGLLAALDIEKGGEVAVNLGRIYEYIANLLLRANLHNDAEALDLAERLLVDISSAWRQIGAGSDSSAGAGSLARAV